MKLLNSIDREKALLPYFITLTYHNSWPEERPERNKKGKLKPHGRKRHLDAFRKRLERVYGQFPAVWRVEFKQRLSGARKGDYAPHIHILAWIPDDQRLRVKNRVAWVWNEIVAPGDMEHLSVADHDDSCQRVRSWRGVNAYAAKYMGKLEQLHGDTPYVGRFWGTWRGEMLPISWATYSLTESGAFRIRRVLRKLSGQRSTHQLHRFGCFVGWGTINRLLAFHGYYRA